MAAIIDSNNDFQNQADDILFGRISNDLLDKGYSTNINALPLSLANLLYLQVSTMTDESFESAAVGRDREHTQNALVRSQKLSWITQDSKAGASWLKWADDLQIYLNRHLFLGLFSFESHYARYSPGDFYKRHYDAFKGQSSRKLSIVVYLNRDWQSSDGGELVLYKADEDSVGLKVLPNFATVVVFLSEDYPHEVLRAHRNRYSIAGWYSPIASNASRLDPPR